MERPRKAHRVAWLSLRLWIDECYFSRLLGFRNSLKYHLLRFILQLAILHLLFSIFLYLAFLQAFLVRLLFLSFIIPSNSFPLSHQLQFLTHILWSFSSRFCSKYSSGENDSIVSVMISAYFRKHFDNFLHTSAGLWTNSFLFCIY